MELQSPFEVEDIVNELGVYLDFSSRFSLSLCSKTLRRFFTFSNGSEPVNLIFMDECFRSGQFSLFVWAIANGCPFDGRTLRDFSSLAPELRLQFANYLYEYFGRSLIKENWKMYMAPLTTQRIFELVGSTGNLDLLRSALQGNFMNVQLAKHLFLGGLRAEDFLTVSNIFSSSKWGPSLASTSANPIWDEIFDVLCSNDQADRFDTLFPRHPRSHRFNNLVNCHKGTNFCKKFFEGANPTEYEIVCVLNSGLAAYCEAGNVEAVEFLLEKFRIWKDPVEAASYKFYDPSYYLSRAAEGGSLEVMEVVLRSWLMPKLEPPAVAKFLDKIAPIPDDPKLLEIYRDLGLIPSSYQHYQEIQIQSPKLHFLYRTLSTRLATPYLRVMSRAEVVEGILVKILGSEFPNTYRSRPAYRKYLRFLLQELKLSDGPRDFDLPLFFHAVSELIATPRFSTLAVLLPFISVELWEGAMLAGVGKARVLGLFRSSLLFNHFDQRDFSINDVKAVFDYFRGPLGSLYRIDKEEWKAALKGIGWEPLWDSLKI